MSNDSKPRSKSKLALFGLVIAGFALMVIFMAAVGVAGIKYSRAMNAANTRLYKDGVLAVSYSSDITALFSRMRSSLRSLALETKPDKLRGYKQDIDVSHYILKDTEKKIMEVVKENPNKMKMLQEVIDAGDNYYMAIGSAVDLAMANRRAEAWSAMNSDVISEITNKFSKATDELNEYVLKISEYETKENDATTRRFQTTIIVLVSMAALAAAACSVFIGITILVVKQ
jgi:hypothetical protein